MRVDELLARASSLGLDRIDSRRLLARRIGRPRSWLIAHGDAEVGDEAAAAALGDFARRADDEPLAYLVGEKEFHGLAFAVSPAVLVPRPETELLVDWAIEIVAGRGATAIADLGTGSGAIAVAIAVKAPPARLTAVDVSPAAIELAARNAAAHGVAIDFRVGSWWQPLAGERFDVVVSNPPYVAAEDPHLPALRHEPPIALVAGADGLAALREIVGGASERLRDDGWLLVEHGGSQGEAVRDLLRDAGFADVGTRRDLAGIERASGGRRSSRAGDEVTTPRNEGMRSAPRWSMIPPGTGCGRPTPEADRSGAAGADDEDARTDVAFDPPRADGGRRRGGGFGVA